MIKAKTVSRKLEINSLLSQLTAQEAFITHPKVCFPEPVPVIGPVNLYGMLTDCSIQDYISKFFVACVFIIRVDVGKVHQDSYILSFIQH
jgi:hypothetical protein